VEIEAGFLCRECRKGLLQMKAFPPVDDLDGGVFFFTYENVIKEAIHKIKFEQDKKFLALLSEETELLLADLTGHRIITNFLADAGKNPCCAEKDCTDKKTFQALSQEVFCRGKREPWLWTGIPTDAARLRQRGFDLPTELFSKGAEAFNGFWTQTLCRTRKTLPMYGLSPEERRQNLQDCFAVTKNVRGKSVMLVDDIFTTGTTFSAAAAVLKEAGAVEVTGMAFCGSIENLR
jgi:predicted amidophosphoribosyltransferase